VVAKFDEEQEILLAFCDWWCADAPNARPGNLIESTFAPVRARTDLTQGPGIREAGVAMIFKLLEVAEGR
jgi:putative transposase